MKLDQETRHRTVRMQEGSILNVAGNSGDEYAVDCAKACIDGMANALIRIEGREKAAEFAFALCDRIVAGIRAPTEIPVVLSREEKAEIVTAAVVATVPAARHGFLIRAVTWLQVRGFGIR